MSATLLDVIVVITATKDKKQNLTVEDKTIMDGKKEWHTPELDEREVGLEVTSYMPAELDTF